jgi:transcriptional regulator with XRE-family HTH domain
MCNTRINEVFRLALVKSGGHKADRPIDRVLEMARAKGMNQVKFAEKMHVAPQHVTNWKSRGMPPEHLPKAADVLGCRVDDLLGRPDASKYKPLQRASQDVSRLHSAWPFTISREIYDRLPAHRKADINSFINAIVSVNESEQSGNEANTSREKRHR